MIRPELFPRLRPDNHRITSPQSARYNCIAWAAEDTSQWWEPGFFWLPPNHATEDFSFTALENVFIALGYERCGMDATRSPAT